MVQLVIDGITLPETSRDKYRCWPQELGTEVEMISGRIVSELRGKVQMIHYEYDYFPAALWRQLAAVLRSGRTFPVTYLPDDGDELILSSFRKISLAEPSFAFSRDGEALWHGINFTLREANPHD